MCFFGSFNICFWLRYDLGKDSKHKITGTLFLGAGRLWNGPFENQHIAQLLLPMNTAEAD